MKREKSTQTILAVVLAVLVLSSPVPSDAAVLYKRYSVHHVNGTDILGEPYTIRKNDYVLKLFKQKGVISQDFPEFLDIFTKINTSVSNIDRIHPGQVVIIPLKKIPPGTFPGQERGVVKIPFITAGNIPQIVRKHSDTYNLKKGDSISRVISREFGAFGSGSYQKGVRLFKLANPHITDLNRVRAGSEVTIPRKELAEKTWYDSLFDNALEAGTAEEGESGEPGEPASEETDTDYNTATPGTADPLSSAAQILGTSLNNRGAFFFPGKRGQDVKLDLSRHPVMNFAGGHRVAFATGEKLSQDERDTIRSFWKNMHFAELTAPLTLGKVLDALSSSQVGILQKQSLRTRKGDLDIEVTPSWFLKSGNISGRQVSNLCIFSADSTDKIPPASLVAFLGSQNIEVRNLLFGRPWNPKGVSHLRKDGATGLVRVNTENHRRFTREILKALDLQYDPSVTISFRYAGFPIQAASAMVSDGSGGDAVIDFGDLQGDSVFAIEKSGLKVICADTGKPPVAILPAILAKLNIESQTDPAFTWRPRTKETSISVKIPGILVKRDKNDRRLFTRADLPDGLMHYLFLENVKIIQGSDKM